MLNRLSWYANRLRSMSAGEVFHRVGEQVKRLSWRRYDEGFDAFVLGDGAIPVVPELRDRLLRPAPPNLDAALAHEANRARLGFAFLGSQWPEGLLDDDGVPILRAWHVDPVTGQEWEGSETYCFNVPYRARADRGDVKLVWELNRLQFLQPIAVHAARSGDGASAARYVMSVVRSWMSANPPFRGVNWNSGIELALRIVTVSIVVTALGRDAFSAEDRALLRTFVNAHAFWLDRFESAYSSANNHLVLESLGLFIAGLLCSDLPRAADWEAKGRATLEREIANQILDDGVGAEQSPTYTGFTVEAYLFAALVARAGGRPLVATVDERLDLAGSWLRWMMDEGGNVPEIGDNDAGRVVALQQEPERDYVASVLGATAAMFDDSAIAPPRSPPHLRDLLFGAAPPPSTGPTGLRVFPEGGYSVWRGSFLNTRVLLVYDHGPLGHLSIAAHGHADTLSVWLHLDDCPVLIDTGTYLYFGDRLRREYARSTIAHNTLTVMNRSSSETAGPFNWRRKATGRLVARQDDGQKVRLVAEHDGYVETFGIVHRRTVEVDSHEHTIRIIDTLGGTNDSGVEIGLLLSPELTVETAEALTIRRDGRSLLQILGPSQLSLDLVVGDEASPGAWTSPAFGVRAPTTQLRWGGTLGGEHSASTRLKVIST
ncbi:MAG: alginate lyase family protein [Bauldia sp.]|nr:alginate lyase family protein [Bauldia sp.]